MGSDYHQLSAILWTSWWLASYHAMSLKVYQIEHGLLAMEVMIVGWDGCYV